MSTTATEPKFTSPALASLRETPQAIADILREHGERRLVMASKLTKSALFDPNSTASMNQMRDALDAEKNGTVARLEDEQGVAGERYARAQAEIASALARPAPANSNEALLRELREQRAWQRQKPVLDKAGDLNIAIGEIAETAAAEGDDDAVYALRAELPAYLIARGMEYLGVSALAAIDDAVASVRPRAEAALEARRELETGWYFVGMAFNHARYGVEHDELHYTLPAWTKNEVIRVELGPVDVRA